jgi:hypothetical protein
MLGNSVAHLYEVTLKYVKLQVIGYSNFHVAVIQILIILAQRNSNGQSTTRIIALISTINGMRSNPNRNVIGMINRIEMPTLKI